MVLNFIIHQIHQVSTALVGAALAGQHMGRAIENAIKGILAQLAAAKITKGILSFLFPASGLASLIKIPSFLGGVFHQGGQVQGYNTGGMVPLQGYASGGGVDNVPAMLQEGEYVMRRSAVQSIGIENLNRMNRTGQSGGVNISFTGNVLSDSFIEQEAIPKIKKAVRRGADLGIA